ncbi:MAG TPA: hemolysin family protein [Alphaproteobacteria bacterium]
MPKLSAMDPSPRAAERSSAGTNYPLPAITQKNGNNNADGNLLLRIIRFLFGSRESRELKEAIAEVISDNYEDAEAEKTAHHQRLLISNVLNLKDMRAYDVMVPRADIVGIEVDTDQKAILELLSQKQYSRLPVYRETLDDVIGTVHIKDILRVTSSGEKLDVRTMVRDVPIVSPAMPVLDLLLMMRQQKKHMVLVVDEYGGIDGLVTINDIVESIVGEIDDEYEQGTEGQMVEKSDGTIMADGRVFIPDFEARFGPLLTEEEREEDIDTLAGLVITLAGRVPARGEILSHPSGAEFEVVEADPRRINRLRIRNLPKTQTVV